MFNKKMVMAFILISFSFTTFAATEISREEAVNYKKSGAVAVSGKDTAEDAVAALHDKVSDKEGEFFTVTRLAVPGDGSKWSANATMYQIR